MQGCATSIVSGSKVQASQLKKVDRDRHVTLGRHMEHIDAEIIDSSDVGSMLYQRLTYLDVPLERGEMHGREPIALVFLVDPSSYLVWLEPL